MSQYSEEIHEAHIECDRGQGLVDLPRFAHKLHALRKVALADGLPHQAFDDLVNSLMPALMEKKRIA